MSELKVNKITPKTGTSIQLGESGDTITIPCGATLTNNGTATGFGLSFCTTVKTSPFTATANKGFLINTGSAVTITLPASPSVGNEIIIVDQTGQAATNKITLGRNGSKIKGSCLCGEISSNRAGVRLVYSGSSQGWITATAGNDATVDTETFVQATGGNTVATCGDYKIHTFTSDGNFVVSATGNPAGSNSVEYLVVAGGAGGSTGGGGAGGFRFASPSIAPLTYPAKPLAGPSNIPVSAQTYPIVVGAGGADGSPTGSSDGASGGNSSFSSITSAGGGGGSRSGSPQNGVAGGSGGGAGADGSGATGGAGNTPPVSPSQGNNGGGSPSTCHQAGGGGGGALAVGANGTQNPSPGSGGGVGGNGGNGGGLPNAFGTSGQNCGSYYYFSGGGAGGSNIHSGCGSPAGRGSGGLGGGGRGGQTNGQVGCNATANTGGGGGGSEYDAGTAGNGGSGIVIIRYKYQ